MAKKYYSSTWDSVAALMTALPTQKEGQVAANKVFAGKVLQSPT